MYDLLNKASSNRFVQKIVWTVWNIEAQYINPLLVKNKRKIFCVGANKTGTTSLKKALEDLDYVVGNQYLSSRLIPHYKNENFDEIIEFCKSAQVFQDIPFSFPHTYKHLDKAYPNAKFILTVRDSPEQWYDSLISFVTKIMGNGNGELPDKADLQESGNVWKGWAWEIFKIISKTPEDDIFNKEIIRQQYKNHNKAVKEYFKDRPEDLLVINVSHDDSYQALIDFLDIKDPPYSSFPWKNKTEEIPVQ